MGFKDWFVDEKSGNYSVKIQCIGCKRITVVKIPASKTFEKWSEKSKCGQCSGSWEKLD
jgi:hypothetical protein